MMDRKWIWSCSNRFRANRRIRNDSADLTELPIFLLESFIETAWADSEVLAGMIKLQARVIALSLGLSGVPLWGQTLETPYSFPAIPPADNAAGRRPVATMVIGPDGNLYGTATQGGANGDGTVFRVSPTTD